MIGLAACSGDNGGDEPGGDAAADAAADTATDTGSDGTADAGLIDAEALILGVDETASVVIPELSGDVQVVITEANVPHVYASNLRDLSIVQGYVTARDRYVELELGRRAASATAASLLGAAGVGIDLGSLSRGSRRVGRQLIGAATDETRARYDAFAIGVNAYIADVRAGVHPVPSELAFAGPLLGFQDPSEMMQPVTGEDLMWFAAYIVYELGFESDDVVREAAAQRLDTHYAADVAFADARVDGLADDLFGRSAPVVPSPITPGFGLTTGDAATTEQKSNLQPSPSPGPTSLGVPASVTNRLVERTRRWTRQIGRLPDAPFGSNGWVVAGEHMDGGGAVLAGDGHLPLTVPTFFYQMGLDTTVFGDGTDDRAQLGLFFPGVPMMAVGTNGDVAWTQTYLNSDITDWYREELVVDEAGQLVATVFEGDERPIDVDDETIEIAALGGGEPTVETIPVRWTFDGRLLVDAEGREVDGPDEAPGAVRFEDRWIALEDLDGDGVIEGVSLDFTGFDVGDTIAAAEGMGRSRTVTEFREATQGLIAYAQNLVVADRDGRIAYTSFNGAPCREYLDRDDDGRWVEGADPRVLLDGTRYGGFTIPRDENGRVTSDDSDPYRCAIPFERWPQVEDPSSGFLVTANQDFAGVTLDDAPWAAEFYLGADFGLGFRASTIVRELRAAVETGGITAEDMVELQANHESRTGQRYAPLLLDAIALARDIGERGAADPWEERLAATYADDRARIDEAADRLSTWLERGAISHSGVDTFYATHTNDERADAVATMIFNAWLRAFDRAVFGDEDVEWVFAHALFRRPMGALDRLLFGRGADNPLALSSHLDATGESAFFDRLGTDEVERSDELMVTALVDALDGLTEPPRRTAVGGFGTDDMDAWLWGLRHQVQLRSLLAVYGGDDPLVEVIAAPFSINTDVLPLADDLDASDPRASLEWFPRPGDGFTVDAADPMYGQDHYFYGFGPVMRMVWHLTPDGPRGYNVLPGGQSALADDPHFADQAARWLGNEAIPMAYAPDEVAAAAIGRTAFVAE